ncbi:MAG: amidase [Planctomycetota bacterium]|jgi:amidase
MNDAPAKPGDLHPESMTIEALQEGMASRSWTARALTDRYLSRIEAIDRNGPGLNAVLAVNPDALADADALDEERRRQGPRGPLHGIPLLIKDNIETAGPMATTAGSVALAEYYAPKDAFLVRKLREAGAVILGKTNLSEWANFRSTRSTSGWSSLGGQTKNPYALDRNPSGSSSGSAVAVAAGLCAAAIGTETNGSIVSPASANSIVGFKPTVGWISRSGIVPISRTQDTAGPLTRSVGDAALLLGALAGTDPRDDATEACKESSLADTTAFLDPGGLRGARIGVARNFFGLHAGVDERINDAIEILRNLGAELVDPAPIETTREIHAPEFEVLLYEFKVGLNAYLAGRPDGLPIHSLEDLIAFNDRNRDRVMPHFAQEIFLEAQAKGPLTESGYLEALASSRRLSREEGIDAVLASGGLDAIVAPTGGLPWLTDWINGDHHAGGCSAPAAAAGYPHITVPAGYVRSLPIGISFFGAAWTEPLLFKLAYAFEQATHHRRPPKFLKTAGEA